MNEIEELSKRIDDFDNSIKKDAILEKFMKSEGAESLPIELVKKLITNDEATSNSNINMLREAMKGYKPVNKPQTTISKEDFNKMQYKDRMQLYNDNKKLYQELI